MMKDSDKLDICDKESFIYELIGLYKNYTALEDYFDLLLHDGGKVMRTCEEDLKIYKEAADIRENLLNIGFCFEGLIRDLKYKTGERIYSKGKLTLENNNE